MKRFLTGEVDDDPRESSREKYLRLPILIMMVMTKQSIDKFDVELDGKKKLKNRRK